MGDGCDYSNYMNAVIDNNAFSYISQHNDFTGNDTNMRFSDVTNKTLKVSF
jgi:hypothetical protein